jgi:multiple sugar transport system permease protein
MTHLRATSKRKGRLLAGLATNGALVLVIVFFGAPFLWIMGAALDDAPIDRAPWPSQPTLENFRVLFEEEDAGLAVRNSLIIATSCMVLGTVLAALAGFGLSRIRMRRKQEIVYVVLLLYAMPLAVTMVAVYDLGNRLDLINTYRGLIVAQTALMLPFLTWLMKGFYDAVPRDLDEAAWLDGGSILRAWLEVLTPLTKAGLVVTAGLAFVIAWSDVLLIIVLVTDTDMATLSQQFLTSAENSREATTAALGMLYFVPVLLVFLLLRRVMLRRLNVQVGE